MRRMVLGLAFVATLVAVYFAPRADSSSVVTPAKPSANAVRETTGSRRAGEHAVAAAMDLQIRPRSPDQDWGNIFVSQTWTPPPELVKPVKEVVIAPPPPEAPALPFQFLGRLVEDGKTAYFLQFNDRNLVMRPGDSVDQTYTLDSIEGGTLTFTYLPLNKKQTLVVGEVN